MESKATRASDSFVCYAIKAQCTNGDMHEGYIRYPDAIALPGNQGTSEYRLVEFKSAKFFETKKDAARIRDWYNKRMGIFTDMEIVAVTVSA